MIYSIYPIESDAFQRKINDATLTLNLLSPTMRNTEYTSDTYSQGVDRPNMGCGRMWYDHRTPVVVGTILRLRPRCARHYGKRSSMVPIMQVVLRGVAALRHDPKPHLSNVCVPPMSYLVRSGELPSLTNVIHHQCHRCTRPPVSNMTRGRSRPKTLQNLCVCLALIDES